MSEGKLQVYAEVLKQKNKTFRMVTIADNTGLSTALISYHFRALLNNGVLSKLGTKYQVIDSDALVEFILEMKSTRINEIENSKVYTKAEALLKALDSVYLARALDLPENDELQREMLEAVNSTLSTFKAARKRLTEGVRNRQPAYKVFKKKWADDYDGFIENFKAFYQLMEVKFEEEEFELAHTRLERQTK